MAYLILTYIAVMVTLLVYHIIDEKPRDEIWKSILWPYLVWKFFRKK